MGACPTRSNKLLNLKYVIFLFYNHNHNHNNNNNNTINSLNDASVILVCQGGVRAPS